MQDVGLLSAGCWVMFLGFRAGHVDGRFWKIWGAGFLKKKKTWFPLKTCLEGGILPKNFGDGGEDPKK